MTGARHRGVSQQKTSWFLRNQQLRRNSLRQPGLRLDTTSGFGVDPLAAIATKNKTAREARPSTFENIAPNPYWSIFASE
jgi:hypothetical protein